MYRPHLWENIVRYLLQKKFDFGGGYLMEVMKNLHKLTWFGML